jgi:hypothetical protein
MYCIGQQQIICTNLPEWLNGFTSSISTISERCLPVRCTSVGLPVSTAACLYTFFPGLSTTRLESCFFSELLSCTACLCSGHAYLCAGHACLLLSVYWACLPVYHTGHACLRDCLPCIASLLGETCISTFQSFPTCFCTYFSWTEFTVSFFYS